MRHWTKRKKLIFWIAMISLVAIFVGLWFGIKNITQVEDGLSGQPEANSESQLPEKEKEQESDQKPTQEESKGVEQIIVQTNPHLLKNGEFDFQTVAVSDPLESWRVVVVAPYAENGPFFQSVIMLKLNGSSDYQAAFPMYATETGDHYKDQIDVPQEVKAVMSSDAKKYHEGVVL